MDSDRLAYSPAEVSALLGVSTRSVVRAVDRGELPSAKLGARRLIPAAAVTRLLGSA